MAIIGGVALSKQLQILLKDKGFDLQDFEKFINFSTGSVDWQLLKIVFDIYNANGDKIATQYTGTKALHGATVVQNKKGDFDLKKKGGKFIAVRRYFGNLYNDLDIQKSMLLYLGQFRPRNQLTDIWEQDLTKKLNSMRLVYNQRTNYLKRWRGHLIFKKAVKNEEFVSRISPLPSIKFFKQKKKKNDDFLTRPILQIMPDIGKIRTEYFLRKTKKFTYPLGQEDQEQIQIPGPFSSKSTHRLVCREFKVPSLKNQDYQIMEFVGHYQDNGVLGLYKNVMKGKSDDKLSFNMNSVHFVRGLMYPDGSYLDGIVPRRVLQTATSQNNERYKRKKSLFVQNEYKLFTSRKN